MWEELLVTNKSGKLRGNFPIELSQPNGCREVILPPLASQVAELLHLLQHQLCPAHLTCCQPFIKSAKVLEMQTVFFQQLLFFPPKFSIFISTQVYWAGDGTATWEVDRAKTFSCGVVVLFVYLFFYLSFFYISCKSIVKQWMNDTSEPVLSKKIKNKKFWIRDHFSIRPLIFFSLLCSILVSCPQHRLIFCFSSLTLYFNTVGFFLCSAECMYAF